MTRGITKAEKVERYEGLVKETDLLHLYLYDTAVKRVKPDAVVKWSNGSKVDRVKGEVALYRATSASGGYVVITSHTGCVGHPDGHATIHYLEDAATNSYDLFGTPALRDAIWEVLQKRNNTVREATA